MKTKIVTRNDIAVAVIRSDTPLMTDVPSALDTVMAIKYETGCTDIAINKEAVADDFFVLSTRLAGDILQKFVDYGIRFAIYGDFSTCESRALRDFIRESNRGRSVYFQPDVARAVEKLTSAAGSRKGSAESGRAR